MQRGEYGAHPRAQYFAADISGGEQLLTIHKPDVTGFSRIDRKILLAGWKCINPRQRRDAPV